MMGSGCARCGAFSSSRRRSCSASNTSFSCPETSPARFSELMKLLLIPLQFHQTFHWLFLKVESADRKHFLERLQIRVSDLIIKTLLQPVYRSPGRTPPSPGTARRRGPASWTGKTYPRQSPQPPREPCGGPYGQRSRPIPLKAHVDDTTQPIDLTGAHSLTGSVMCDPA